MSSLILMKLLYIYTPTHSFLLGNKWGRKEINFRSMIYSMCEGIFVFSCFLIDSVISTNLNGTHTNEKYIHFSTTFTSFFSLSLSTKETKENMFFLPYPSVFPLRKCNVRLSFLDANKKRKGKSKRIKICFFS